MKTAILIACGVLYGLVALLMVGAVLLQESKGGGLAALGGTRAESAFGASNPLRRLTAGLAVVFFILASLLALGLAPAKSKAETAVEENEGEPTMGGTSEGEGDTEKPKDTPKEEPKKESEKKPAEGVEMTVPIKDGEKAPEGDKGDKSEEKPAEEVPEKPAEKPAGG